MAVVQKSWVLWFLNVWALLVVRMYGGARMFITFLGGVDILYYLLGNLKNKG